MSALPEQIRAFVAVRIPETVVAQLIQVQDQLKSEFQHDVSWTRAAAMHVTLQFLGNIKSAEVPKITAALGQAAREASGFEIALGAPGTFGNRVLWVGIEKGKEPLMKLSDAVRRATHGFGSHTEIRSFSAHVTLGRFRRPVRGVAAVLRKIQTPP